VTPAADLPTQGREKLEQKVVDFERIDEAGLKEGQWDVVLVVMGTTAKAAGSPDNFTRIDKEYVVNAAKAAKADKDQRLIYLSTYMANPNSSALYTRSKGLTEKALAELGYKDTIIFRPGLLTNTQRPESRFGETALQVVTGIFSLFSNRFQIDVDKLAKSICVAGEQGTSGLPSNVHAPQENWGGRNFTMIGNKEAMALSQ